MCCHESRFEQTVHLGSPDYDALIVFITKHVVVGVVCDSEDVGRQLPYLPVCVLPDGIDVIEREHLVRVDSDQNRTGVCLILKQKESI